MQKLREAKRLAVVVALAVLTTVAVASLAIADVIVADANKATSNVVEGHVEKAPGTTGEALFGLKASKTPSGDPEGCNAGTGGSKPPVVLAISSNQAWLTVTQSSVQVTGCDTGGGSDSLNDGLQNGAQINYQVSSSAPGGATAVVTATYQSGGVSGGKYESGSFQVKTPAPSDTTAPTSSASAKNADNSAYNFGDWTKQNVTATLSGSDNTGGSGLKEIRYTTDGTEPTKTHGAAVANNGQVTVTDEGTTMLRFVAIDNAGNVESPVNSRTVKIDKTKPSITDLGATAAADGDNGWYRSNVTNRFKAEDTRSGLSSACDAAFDQDGDVKHVTISSEGSSQTGSSGSCTDNAGNQAASIESAGFKIDKTNPVISPDSDSDSCSTPGDNGWCRGEQTAGFSASDATSGLVDQDSPYAFTESTSDNGHAVKISSGTLKDNAGNEATAIDAGPFKIDSVDPTIDGSASPAANSDGWNRTDVKVEFACGDTNGSGVASCGPDKTLTEEGRGQSVAGQAKDEAGNTASDSVSSINIDKTGPSVPTASFDKSKAYTDGDGTDWFKDSVTVSYGGSADPDLDDARDGIADKSGSGVKGYSANDSLSSSGTLAYSGKATDRADNDSSAASGSVKVDADRPTVSLTCPSSVKVGTTQSAGWTAQDGQSGLATAPSGSVSLDTSSIGPKTATVAAGTAKDNVGHDSALASCQYNVVYDFRGFFQPVDMGGVFNRVKAGSSIPVKFSVDGTPGNGSSGVGSEASPVASGYPTSGVLTCNSTAVTDAIEETVAAGSSSLKYDPIADQWVYVWKTSSTWGGTCRQLVVKLADGTTQRANFQFTK